VSWFGKKWEDPLETYRNYVRQIAESGSSAAIPSNEAKHAAIVTQQLLSIAKDEVSILTWTLPSQVFGDEEVLEAASVLIQKNPSVRIRLISAEPIAQSHPLVEVLRHGPGFQCRVVSSEIRNAAPFSFVVVDSASYRVETDPTRPAAITQFGNPESGLRLQQSFDMLFAQATVGSFSSKVPQFSVSSIIIPERPVAEGTLIKSTSTVWTEIVRRLDTDWALAYQLSPRAWEEIIAGAFKNDAYDEVILTPGSGDHGRDVIAIKHGIGSVKIIGSVKAYKPGHLVPYDAVRSLLGVLNAEQNASKAIITTTSDFPPRIALDPFIARHLPTRLELMNGDKLRRWLNSLSKPTDSTTA
jgi:restriction system protein